MKELLESLYIVDQAEALFDTCFFIYELKHHKHLKGAVTSFNAEEILHVTKKLSSNLKKEIRDSLKHHELSVVRIPVSPGNKEEEYQFVMSIDSELMKLIRDPSDAVLIAAAVKIRAKTVYTRDKHHLYTDKLSNYLKQWGIEVLNKCE